MHSQSTILSSILLVILVVLLSVGLYSWYTSSTGGFFQQHPQVKPFSLLGIRAEPTLTGYNICAVVYNPATSPVSFGASTFILRDSFGRLLGTLQAVGCEAGSHATCMLCASADTLPKNVDNIYLVSGGASASAPFPSTSLCNVDTYLPCTPLSALCGGVGCMASLPSLVRTVSVSFGGSISSVSNGFVVIDGNYMVYVSPVAGREGNILVVGAVDVACVPDTPLCAAISDEDNSIHIIDFSAPLQPVERNVVYIPSVPTHIAAGANILVVTSKEANNVYVYSVSGSLLTFEGNAYVPLADHASIARERNDLAVVTNGSSVLFVGLAPPSVLGSYSYPGGAVATPPDSNIAYVSHASLSQFAVIDYSSPATPSEIVPYGYRYNTSFVAADCTSGVCVVPTWGIDTADPAYPVGLYQLPSVDNVVDVAVGSGYVAEVNSNAVVLFKTDENPPGTVSGRVLFPYNSPQFFTVWPRRHLAFSCISTYLVSIDLSNVKAPAVLQVLLLPGSCYDLTGVEEQNRVYVRVYNYVLSINAENPSSMYVESNVYIPGAGGVDADPSSLRAVVTSSGSSTVFVLDLSNPPSIQKEGNTTVQFAKTARVIPGGKYAAVGGGLGAFALVNMSSPASPYVESNLTFPDLGYIDVTSDGKFAVVTGDTSFYVYIVDLRDPSAIYLLSSYYIRAYPYGVVVDKRGLAYIDTADGIRVLDLSDPAAPKHVGTLLGAHLSREVLNGSLYPLFGYPLSTLAVLNPCPC